MTDASTAAIVAGTFGVGGVVLGTVVGQVLASRNDRKVREAEAAQRRSDEWSRAREAAAPAMVQVGQFLDATYPVVVTMGIERDDIDGVQERYSALWSQKLEAMTAITTQAYAHPSDEVRALASELVRQMTMVTNRVHELLMLHGQGRNDPETLADGEEVHVGALAAFNALLSALTVSPNTAAKRKR